MVHLQPDNQTSRDNTDITKCVTHNMQKDATHVHSTVGVAMAAMPTVFSR